MISELPDHLLWWFFYTWEEYMIKVSVIIPVYNVDKYLEECLQSVCSQTLKDIEIICINDGSTDKSGQILKDFAKKDKRIVLIEQKNQGVSIARNNGIKAAKGEYIGFVDSDDWIDPDFYEKLYKTAKKFDADIALAGFYNAISKNKAEKIRKRFLREKLITNFNKKMQLLEESGTVWTKIFKKEFLDITQIFFQEDVTYEDRIWLPQIYYKAKKVCIVPKVYYHYRENPSSIVHTTLTNPTFYKNSMEASKFHYNFIRKHKLNWKLPERSKFQIYLLGLPLMKLVDAENYWKFYICKIPLLKIKRKYFHHSFEE